MYSPKKTRLRKYSQRKKRKLRKFKLLVLLAILLIALLAGKLIWSRTHHTHKEATNSKQVVVKTKPVKQVTTKKMKTTNFKTVNKLDSLNRYLTSLHFSGTVLVVRRGNIILHKSYRYSNQKKRIKNTNATVYYIGSAQKSFIATSILQLQDQHKLDVDDPIANYLHGFPNGKNIKIRNLLTHTSGLIGHTEGQQAITPKELIKDIERKGTSGNPGTWHYLDSNYTVLAYLVEKISKQPLESYLKKHIFKPAGIKGSGFYQSFSKNPHASTGYYLKKDGTLMVPSLPDLSQLYGVGNMYMQAHDMYLFDKALMNGKLISSASRKEMFTKGSISGYGFGFYNDPGSYSNHGVLNGWNVSNSFTHTGKTFVILFSNIQNNIPSFGKVNNHLYELLNKSRFQ